MAMYHFTIKTDKKPDGTKISALIHTEYINRENKYKDYDLKNEIFQQEFKNSIIANAENSANSALGDKKILLYHSALLRRGARKRSAPQEGTDLNFSKCMRRLLRATDK